MQLTGEGLASSNPPRYMHELISSVRYHYQYQCLFAAQDDSVLIYGEKSTFFILNVLSLFATYDIINAGLHEMANEIKFVDGLVKTANEWYFH